MKKIVAAVLAVCFSGMLTGCNAGSDQGTSIEVSTSIESLSDLSVETLRGRKYGSTLKLVSQLGTVEGGTEYSDAYAATGSGPYETYIAEYDSDGLRVYTRLDIPNTPMPQGGYPVIIFCHGWIGIEAAPSFHFSYTPDSMYAELIDGYVDAGFVVLTPGYRGHGTVNREPADGIEFMEAWDNASYLSPSFYAIDTLNLLNGVSSIEQLDFTSFDTARDGPIKVSRNEIFLSGHSQGGDVVLTALAVAGEGSAVGTSIAGASISDGTFADRPIQLELFAAMQGSRWAFLAGDGTWTGTATGSDGTINQDFVFGYPPQWIETPQPDEWTWQNDDWPDIPVTRAVADRYREMAEVLTAGVTVYSHMASEDLLSENSDPGVDKDIATAMRQIGGYDFPQFLSEPLILHYSDQDYYSPPPWNVELCERISNAGGECNGFLYPANSHLMRAADQAWFSPPGTVDSYRTILDRDVLFFLGGDPSKISYP